MMTPLPSRARWTHSAPRGHQEAARSVLSWLDRRGSSLRGCACPDGDGCGTTPTCPGVGGRSPSMRSRGPACWCAQGRVSTRATPMEWRTSLCAGPFAVRVARCGSFRPCAVGTWAVRRSTGVQAGRSGMQSPVICGSWAVGCEHRWYWAWRSCRSSGKAGRAIGFARSGRAGGTGTARPDCMRAGDRLAGIRLAGSMTEPGRARPRSAARVRGRSTVSDRQFGRIAVDDLPGANGVQRPIPPYGL